MTSSGNQRVVLAGSVGILSWFESPVCVNLGRIAKAQTVVPAMSAGHPWQHRIAGKLVSVAINLNLSSCVIGKWVAWLGAESLNRNLEVAATRLATIGARRAFCAGEVYLPLIPAEAVAKSNDELDLNLQTCSRTIAEQCGAPPAGPSRYFSRHMLRLCDPRTFPSPLPYRHMLYWHS